MEERLRELLFSDGFALYVKLQAEAGAKFAAEIWRKDVSPEYVRGVMEGISKMLKVASDQATAKEDKERLQALQGAAFKSIEVNFAREMVGD